MNTKVIFILVITWFCMSVAHAKDTPDNRTQDMSDNRIQEMPDGLSQEMSASAADEPVIADKRQTFRRHRIFVNYNVGYANSIYAKTENSFMHENYSLGSAVELRYAYFFTPKWGVSLGAGVSLLTAQGALNMEGVIPRYNDPDFDPSGQRFYDLHYKVDNLNERQQIWALVTPLQFHFSHRFADGKRGILASLGAKGYLPIISAQSAFQQGKGAVTLTGYEAFTNTQYTDPPHFGAQEVRTTPETVKLQYSVDATADFGGLFRLSGVCDLYVGAYGSYGFMDVLPKTADKKDFITPEYNKPFVVNSLLSSNILAAYNGYINDNRLNWKKADEKWNLWQVGIKIGIHFNMP